MSSAQKIIQAAAGNAAGEATYVEDVFSTYLYEGTGAAQTITNDIDLDGEGGLVWVKPRPNTNNHRLHDTERGAGFVLSTNLTSASESLGNGVTSFNSDGFTLGTNSTYNGSGVTFASWTFRKAPKFFDVVTYTGDGVAGRTVSHNLGSVPGCIIVKSTSNVSNWLVYHRGTGATKELYLQLTTAAYDDNVGWNDTEPTDSVFTVGTSASTNSPGRTYVAYLFAHNDGDGIFGENADQDIIKCGSYTGGAGGITSVDLGFEPQWVLRKKTSGTDDWLLLDVMRGFASSDGDPALFPNTSGAESVPGFSRGKPTATGFVDESGSTGASYIYIAIRRGPMKTPESGTEVFDINTFDYGSISLPYKSTSGIVTDLSIDKGYAGTYGVSVWNWQSRLQGTAPILFSEQTSAESTGGNLGFDFNDGVEFRNTVSVASGSDNVHYQFRRAPGFFDVVAYEGDGASGHEISHNLGVVPEMIIVKNRTSTVGTRNWMFYHKDLGGSDKYMYLNLSDSVKTAPNVWVQPTESVFTVGAYAEQNENTYPHIAYLFATLPGVSKVGSYTGNGSSQTIDCGFSPRFLLIKKALNGTGGWFVFDTERGIVAGNDPYLFLNTTDAENTGADTIDPVANGFIVNDNNTNANTDGYIFLAIA